MNGPYGTFCAAPPNLRGNWRSAVGSCPSPYHQISAEQPPNAAVGPRPIVSGPGAGDGAAVGGRPARLNVRSPFGLLAVRRAGEREHPSRRAIHAPARRCSSGSGSGCIWTGEGCHSNRRLVAAGQVTLEIRKWGLAKGAQFLAEPKDQGAGSARSPALGCTRSCAGLAATACTGLAWLASQQAPGRDACG